MNGTGFVDSHVHLWNPQQLRHEWLDGLPQLNRPFLPGDVAAATAPAGVTKMVLAANCRRRLETVLQLSAGAGETARQKPFQSNAEKI